MTVAELIDYLEDLDPDSEIRLAIQPSWPLQFGIADVQVVDTPHGEQIAYITHQDSHPDDSPYAPAEIYGR